MKKINAKQRGVTIIEFLMASALFLLLAFSFSKVQDTRQKDKDYKERSVSTAEQIVKFSEASYRLTAGIGGIDVQEIDVEYLKDASLLPLNFPNKTPFGQEIKGFFITSPENQNVIDVLVTTTGEIGESFVSQDNIQDNLNHESIQERTFLSLRRSELELDTNFNDEYHLGKVKNNIFRSTGNTHVQDINFFNADIDTENFQPSVLLKAPNQKGYWVMTLGTWMNSGTCNGVNPNATDGRNNRPICSAYASVGNNSQNRGFSYECPSSGYVVNKNENNVERSLFYDKKSRGGDSSGGRTYCFHAYKGDVKADIDFTFSRHVFNGHPNGSSKSTNHPLVVPKGDAPGTVYMDETPYAQRSVYRHNDNHNISLTSISGLNNYRFIHPNVRGKMSPLANFVNIYTMTFEADGSYYQVFNILNVLNTGSTTYASSGGNSERSVSTKMGYRVNPANRNRLTVNMRYWRNRSAYNGYYDIILDTPKAIKKRP